MTHSQMFQKVESDLPAKIGRLVECRITSLWEDLEAKLLTPGQLLGYP